MTTSSTLAHPVRTLREHVTALEAAITLCLADPKPKAVHRLRTTTRRIEGQLAMLGVLSGVPNHQKPARKANRALRKLRRAAGNVRDIDVQIDLIGSVASEKPSRPLKQDSIKLRKILAKDREEFSQKLVRILHREQADLALTLESLFDTLEPAESLALAPTQLVALTQSWFKQNTPPAPKDDSENPDHLHDIRKVAKLARYIAENAPKRAKTPRRVAESFEKLQQSGGDWHDWLVLSEIARDELGTSSPLTETLMRRSHTALTSYRRHLGEMLG